LLSAPTLADPASRPLPLLKFHLLPSASARTPVNVKESTFTHLAIIVTSGGVLYIPSHSALTPLPTK
ncbi:UNVERIFIED_CONTAM: hypothetical protein NY603_24540, partial [Bacteroidetes bacterium 56_B9]